MGTNSEDKDLPVSFLARQARGETQHDFARVLGIHPVTQASRETNGKRLKVVPENLYRLVLAAEMSGLREIVDISLQYEGKKSEEESFMRLVGGLISSGKGAVVQAALANRFDPEGEEEIKVEYTLPILEALVHAYRKEAQKTGSNRARSAADDLDNALLKAKALLQEQKQAEAMEHMGKLKKKRRE